MYFRRLQEVSSKNNTTVQSYAIPKKITAQQLLGKIKFIRELAKSLPCSSAAALPQLIESDSACVEEMRRSLPGRRKTVVICLVPDKLYFSEKLVHCKCFGDSVELNCGIIFR